VPAMPSAHDAQRRLMVRLAALAIACTLAQAITGLEVALWATPLLLIAALLCLILIGPGAFSIDHRRERSAAAYAAGRARLRSKY